MNVMLCSRLDQVLPAFTSFKVTFLQMIHSVDADTRKLVISILQWT